MQLTEGLPVTVGNTPGFVVWSGTETAVIRTLTGEGTYRAEEITPRVARDGATGLDSIQPWNVL